MSVKGYKKHLIVKEVAIDIGKNLDLSNISHSTVLIKVSSGSSPALTLNDFAVRVIFSIWNATLVLLYSWNSKVGSIWFWIYYFLLSTIVANFQSKLKYVQFQTKNNISTWLESQTTVYKFCLKEFTQKLCNEHFEVMLRSHLWVWSKF